VDRSNTDVVCPPEDGHASYSVNINKSSGVAEMGDRGHNKHGPKRRGAAVPFSRELGPLSNTTCMAWAAVYFRTKRRIRPSSPLATIDMSQKLGGMGVPFFLGVAGSTSNTMSRRPRHISVPSGILIHAAVWPQ